MYDRNEALYKILYGDGNIEEFDDNNMWRYFFESRKRKAINT